MIKALFGKTLQVARSLAPVFATELNLARDKLAELRDRRGQLAFDQAAGLEGSETALAEWRAEVAAQEAVVADIEAGHAVALAKDKAADLARRLAGQTARVASLRQHQAAAERSALKIETHIQNLIYEWQQQQEINGKIANLVAADGRYPDHSLIPFHSLREAVAEELYRVGAGPISSSGTSAFAFPGAAVHDLRHQGDPAALPTFSSKVKARAAWLLDALGASPAAPPTPAPPPPPPEPAPAVAAPEPRDDASSDLAVYARLIQMQGTHSAAETELRPVKLEP